jgi:hypothetical protein
MKLRYLLGYFSKYPNKEVEAFGLMGHHEANSDAFFICKMMRYFSMPNFSITNFPTFFPCSFPFSQSDL